MPAEIIIFVLLALDIVRFDCNTENATGASYVAFKFYKGFIKV